MNQKEYELIAGVIKTAMAWAGADKMTVDSIAREFIDQLEQYPNFDRNKFLTACGLGG